MSSERVLFWEEELVRVDLRGELGLAMIHFPLRSSKVLSLGAAMMAMYKFRNARCLGYIAEGSQDKRRYRDLGCLGVMKDNTHGIWPTLSL